MRWRKHEVFMRYVNYLWLGWVEDLNVYKNKTMYPFAVELTLINYKQVERPDYIFHACINIGISKSVLH